MEGVPCQPTSRGTASLGAGGIPRYGTTNITMRFYIYLMVAKLPSNCVPSPFSVFSIWLKQCDYFEKSHISYDASAASLCSHGVSKTLNGLKHMEGEKNLFVF